jgi:hypothetical protein
MMTFRQPSLRLGKDIANTGQALKHQVARGPDQERSRKDQSKENSQGKHAVPRKNICGACHKQGEHNELSKDERAERDAEQHVFNQRKPRVASSFSHYNLDTQSKCTVPKPW